MVFTRKVNDAYPGLAGFVVGCDLEAVPTSSNTQTNGGEFFYAMAPTQATGTLGDPGSHLKSEWESREGNLPYGSANLSNGIWCGVRGCAGKARGIVRVFEELAPTWYRSTHLYSPLGRANADDFSFYATGWSLVRWAIDHGPMPEPDFLKALTQEQSLTGVANLEARVGRSFADMLPEWSLAMVLDDHPDFVPQGPMALRLTQPSWHFRNVYSGYKTDFGSVSWDPWPFRPHMRPFSSVDIEVQVLRPGTSIFFELEPGVASTQQLVELRAINGSAAAPAELSISFVRIR